VGHTFVESKEKDIKDIGVLRKILDEVELKQTRPGPLLMKGKSWNVKFTHAEQSV